MPENNEEKPWEMSWGEEEQPEQASPSDRSLPPWEQDWGEKEWMNSFSPPSSAYTDFNRIIDRMWEAESGNRHTDDAGNLITSPAGAKGISQLMDSTAAKPGFGIKPVQNTSEAEYDRVGREYAFALFDKYGDAREAVAAYNAGPGNVDKALRMAASKGGDFTNYLPKPEETIPYLRKVLGDNNAS